MSNDGDVRELISDLVAAVPTFDKREAADKADIQSS